MSSIKDFFWFARQSWHYLGCNKGTGRYGARWRYAKGFVSAAKSFIAATRRDRLESTGGHR